MRGQMRLGMGLDQIKINAIHVVVRNAKHLSNYRKYLSVNIIMKCPNSEFNSHETGRARDPKDATRKGLESLYWR